MPNILLIIAFSALVFLSSTSAAKIFDTSTSVALWVISLGVFSFIPSLLINAKKPLNRVIESYCAFIIANTLTFGYLSNILLMSFVHDSEKSFPLELIPLSLSTMVIMTSSLLFAISISLIYRNTNNEVGSISFKRIAILSFASLSLVIAHCFFFLNVSFLSYFSIVEIFMEQSAKDYNEINPFGLGDSYHWFLAVTTVVILFILLKTIKHLKNNSLNQ